MFRVAYNLGMQRAFETYKVAGTSMGATPASSLTNGALRLPYAPKPTTNPAPGEPYQVAGEAKARGAVDSLWNISDLSRMAPGNVSGFGQEVIG